MNETENDVYDEQPGPDFTDVVDAIEATAETLRDNQFKYRINSEFGSVVYDNVLDAAIAAGDLALAGQTVIIEAITATIRLSEFTG